MRDKPIHHCFGVNWEIVWDVVKKRLPELKAQIESSVPQSPKKPKN